MDTLDTLAILKSESWKDYIGQLNNGECAT